MLVTLKEYVSMLNGVYICVGNGSKLENCFCSTPLALCCSSFLKRERNGEEKDKLSNLDLASGSRLFRTFLDGLVLE